MTTNNSSEYGPVTAIVKRRIKPGRQQEFEAWYSGFIQEAAKSTGYLGVNIIRPTDPANPEYVFIMRFDSYENSKAWDESPVRLELLAKSQDLAEEPPRIQKFSGLDYWFTLPEHATTALPSRHKMTTTTILAAYPLALILNFVLNPFLSGINLYLATLINIAIFICLMTYAVMPLMTRLLSFWLYNRYGKTSKESAQSGV